MKNLHRGHVAKSFGLRDLPDESNNHTIKDRQRTFGSTEQTIEDEPKEFVKTERPNRTRLRNFSHISEFGNGLETTTTTKKKNKDKIGEFLEKKRERNTNRRLFGRQKS